MKGLFALINLVLYVYFTTANWAFLVSFTEGWNEILKWMFMFTGLITPGVVWFSTGAYLIPLLYYITLILVLITPSKSAL